MLKRLGLGQETRATQSTWRSRRWTSKLSVIKRWPSETPYRTTTKLATLARFKKTCLRDYQPHRWRSCHLGRKVERCPIGRPLWLLVSVCSPLRILQPDSEWELICYLPEKGHGALPSTPLEGRHHDSDRELCWIRTSKSPTSCSTNLGRQLAWTPYWKSTAPQS